MEKGLGDLSGHRHSRRLQAGAEHSSPYRGRRRSRTIFRDTATWADARPYHAAARDADRQQTVLYHVRISRQSHLQRQRTSCSALHRRGTGKGSAQRSKILIDLWQPVRYTCRYRTGLPHRKGGYNGKSENNNTPILYGRLSQEDERAGESNSIQHQELLCRGWFLPPNTYDCGSFVVNGTAVVGKEPKKAL